MPVTGVDGADGALGILAGVEGRATADILNWSMWETVKMLSARTLEIEEDSNSMSTKRGEEPYLIEHAFVPLPIQWQMCT